MKSKKEANSLTYRKGAQTTLSGPEPFCGKSKCTFEKEFLKKEETEKKHWKNFPEIDNSKKYEA